MVAPVGSTSAAIGPVDVRRSEYSPGPRQVVDDVAHTSVVPSANRGSKTRDAPEAIPVSANVWVSPPANGRSSSVASTEVAPVFWTTTGEFIPPAPFFTTYGALSVVAPPVIPLWLNPTGGSFTLCALTTTATGWSLVSTTEY